MLNQLVSIMFTILLVTTSMTRTTTITTTTVVVIICVYVCLISQDRLFFPVAESAPQQPWMRCSRLDYLSLDFNSASPSPVLKVRSMEMSCQQDGETKMTHPQGWEALCCSHLMFEFQSCPLTRLKC